MDGCVNQHGQFGQTPCYKDSYQEDFCERFGVGCVRISVDIGDLDILMLMGYRMARIVALLALEREGLAHR